MAETIKVVKFSEEHLDEALEILHQTFFRDEKVCVAVDLLNSSPDLKLDKRYKTTTGTQELTEMILEVKKDNLSVVALDRVTNKVVGFAFNKLQTLPRTGEENYFEKKTKQMKDASAIGLMKFMIEADSKIDLFKYCDTDCVMEVTFLGVSSAEKGKGIATALLKKTVEVAQELKSNAKPGSPAPTAVTAIFTSIGSQTAGKKSGFEHVLEVPYSEFTFNGHSYDAILGPSVPMFTLSVKKLN